MAGHSARLSPPMGAPSRIRPAYAIAASLVVAAVGLVMLTQVGAEGGLDLLVASSTVMGVGLGPMAALGTDLVVGAAPAQRAGIDSEAARESLGGAVALASELPGGEIREAVRSVSGPSP